MNKKAAMHIFIRGLVKRAEMSKKARVKKYLHGILDRSSEKIAEEMAPYPTFGEGDYAPLKDYGKAAWDTITSKDMWHDARQAITGAVGRGLNSVGIIGDETARYFDPVEMGSYRNPELYDNKFSKTTLGAANGIAGAAGWMSPLAPLFGVTSAARDIDSGNYASSVVDVGIAALPFAKPVGKAIRSARGIAEPAKTVAKTRVGRFINNNKEGAGILASQVGAGVIDSAIPSARSVRKEKELNDVRQNDLYVKLSNKYGRNNVDDFLTDYRNKYPGATDYALLTLLKAL